MDSQTCAEREAGLFGHVAQADRDAVSTSRLQTFQRILHSVVLSTQLVVTVHLTDHIPHMDHIYLKRKKTKKQIA